MKKSFQIFGIITLLVGSFIYNERVGIVSKLNDDLLTEIEDKQNQYQSTSVEAIIKNDTIIPGKNGREVDVKKTYAKMRQIGYFDEKLLVYKPKEVKKTLKNNKDKYIISGNKSEKKLTLIFKVNNKTNLNEIIRILDKTNTKATFFIESSFVEKNYNLVIRLIKKGHTIGNLSKNEDYSHPDFVWMKTIVTNTGKQKYNYCYAKAKSKTTLKNCKLQDSYTIIPTIQIKDRPFINTKNNISKGSLISLEVTKELETELENIINYITSRGYQIVSLEQELKE